jgi:hypothetical protein
MVIATNWVVQETTKYTRAVIPHPHQLLTVTYRVVTRGYLPWILPRVDPQDRGHCVHLHRIMPNLVHSVHRGHCG